MVWSRGTRVGLGLILVVVLAVGGLAGCSGDDLASDLLQLLTGLWGGTLPIPVQNAAGTIIHGLGSIALDLNSSSATAVGPAAAGVPVVFSANVDLGYNGGWDYNLVLQGTATANGNGVHIVCDTPLGSATTDTVTLDLTTNSGRTELTGTIIFNHGGEDFTGDLTLTKTN